MAKTGKVVEMVKTEIQHSIGNVELISRIKSIPNSENLYIDYSHSCYPFEGAASLYISTSYAYASSIKEAKAKISTYSRILMNSYKIVEL